MPNLSHSEPSRLQGAKAIFTRDLKYNLNGHWGMVDTPTALDAKSVAEQAFRHHQFIRPQAIFEILTHAFDNVANYSGESGYARGTIRVFETNEELVFRVENSSRTGLSQKLLERAITPAAGIISLAKEDRHPTESGGGFGLRLMTEWLPYVYRSDVVETDKTGSLRWYQKQGTEERFDIAFELRIPVPSLAEQSKLLEEQAAQQRVEQHWAAAEVVLDRWKAARIHESVDPVPDAEITACTRAAESLSEASERGERIGLRHSTIAQALKGLGPRASAAAPSLRRCMLAADTTYHSHAALVAVEIDPEQSIQFFTENLPGLIKKLAARNEPDDRPVAAIANYAAQRGSMAAIMQDGLLLAFDAGLARSNLTAALSAVPLSDSNRRHIVTSFRDALSKEDAREDNLGSHAKVLAGQWNLSDEELNLLMDGLTSPASYQIGQVLEALPLKQPQIDHARALLEVALKADKKVELYDLCKTIERCEGDKSALFSAVRPMLFDPRYNFNASKLLEQMNLDSEKIAALVADTAAALQHNISAKNGGTVSRELHYPLQFLSKHAAQAVPIRDTLVDTLIAGIEEYSVARILKNIEINDQQRQRIAAEVTRRKRSGEDSVYYLGQVLKK